MFKIIILLFIALNGVFYLNSCGSCMSGCDGDEEESNNDGNTDTQTIDYFEKTATVSGKLESSEVESLIPPTVPVPDNVAVTALVTRSDLLTRNDLISRSDFFRLLKNSTPGISSTLVSEDTTFDLSVPIGFAFIMMVTDENGAFLGILKHKKDEGFVASISISENGEGKKYDIGNITANVELEHFESENNILQMGEEVTANVVQSGFSVEINGEAAKDTNKYDLTVNEKATYEITVESAETVYFNADLADFCEFADNGNNTATLTCETDEDDTGVFTIPISIQSSNNNTVIVILLNVSAEEEEASEGEGEGEGETNACTISSFVLKHTIAAGSAHTCFVRSNGRVVCWGDNQYGQLGYGDTTTRGNTGAGNSLNLPYLDFSDNTTKITSVAAGLGHTCALFENGKVKCWGLNDKGQLGLENTNNMGDDSGEMGAGTSYLDFGSAAGNVTSIATGNYYTCALFENGAAKCWGDNQYGQLNLGDILERGNEVGEMGDSLSLLSFGTSFGKVQKISAGAGHLCTILENSTDDKLYGAIKCSGLNSNGQLGLGDTSNRGIDALTTLNQLSEVSLNESPRARSVAASSTSTCAVFSDCTLKCWGNNDYGQLGLGDKTTRGDGASEMDTNLPYVDLNGDIIDVVMSGSGSHVCAVIEETYPYVKCWGLNNYGQLGIGSTNNIGDGANEMGSNLDLLDNGRINDITLGESHTCASLMDGWVQCWGRNNKGQLGLGDTTDRGGITSNMVDLGSE